MSYSSLAYRWYITLTMCLITINLRTLYTADVLDRIRIATYVHVAKSTYEGFSTTRLLMIPGIISKRILKQNVVRQAESRPKNGNQKNKKSYYCFSPFHNRNSIQLTCLTICPDLSYSVISISSCALRRQMPSANSKLPAANNEIVQTTNNHAKQASRRYINE